MLPTDSPTSASVDQGRYQVRMEWGVGGLARLAPADVVVVVDVLETDTAVASAVATAAAAGGAVVFAAGLRDASAVAHAVLAEQERRAQRTSIAVIACADEDAAGPRVTVEDLLGAGAVLDALAALGIDHSSPEAAASCESFRGLRGAVRHLLTASGSGQALIAAGRKADVVHAGQLDADDTVRMLASV